MEIEGIIKQLIVSITTEPKASLGVDDLLIESGILDSLGILKLIAAIEEKYDFKVLDEDLIPENFYTIRDIKNFIERKQRLK